MLKRIIEANTIKQGSAITYTTAAGSSEILNASQANNAIENSGIFVGSRMKLNRYYSGDAAGGSSGPTAVTYTIAAGADDGKASDLQSSASTNSTYDTSFSNSIALPFLGVQYDSDEVEYDYTAGYFRFNNIVAAQGATVQSAYLKLNKRGGNFTSGVDNDFYVAAYDEDNQAAPTIASHLNHSNYTTAEVTWNSATDTGNGTLRSAANGTVLSSPDIKTVIQEILDRSGWSSGNSIVLAFYVKAKVTYKTTHVRFENYDDSGDVPPQLEITI